MILPPRIKTTECSWRLCPSPGMYAVTSMLLESRTRAIFRIAELGFFGVIVVTRTHTPRFWGFPCNAGAFDLNSSFFLPFFTSWLIVGIRLSLPPFFSSLRPHPFFGLRKKTTRILQPKRVLCQQHPRYCTNRYINSILC